MLAKNPLRRLEKTNSNSTEAKSKEEQWQTYARQIQQNDRGQKQNFKGNQEAGD